MTVKFKYYLIIFMSILAIGCSQPKQVIPPGNVERINTEMDDTAPSQKTTVKSNVNPCYAEFDAEMAPDSVYSSEQILEKMIGKKTVENAGALNYIAKDHGFFSISHPPDLISSQVLEIPLSGAVGGTDIFEFDFAEGEYKYKNPGEPVNTKTWDSHPFAVQSGSGKLLLIWSSDRADYVYGQGSPFLNEKRVTELGDTVYGNSDLYYAFRENGEWGKVHNFSEISDDINSGFNDETPHLYCLCYNTVLLFSSNRDSSVAGDYDIFKAGISIDFDNEKIAQTSPVQPLARGKDTINTEAKEFFPYIPAPYPEGKNTRPDIYFASDRYREKIQLSGKKFMQNIGGNDIYKFSTDLECRPPKITYNVEIIDARNPAREVRQPVVELREAGLQPDSKGKLLEKSKENPAQFQLKPGVKYQVYGGSLYDKIECKGQDSVLSHYADTSIVHAEPLISKRDTVIEKDSIIASNVEIVHDTIITEKSFHKDKLAEVTTDANRSIQSLNMAGDSIDVVFREINRREKFCGGDTITVERQTTAIDTIPQFDTLYIRNTRELALSGLTDERGFMQFRPEQDTTIDDKINIFPRYYRFPPCKWEYITHLADYRRNVPYFQTGFWEVNTTGNLQRHLRLVESEKYDDASFIELHPKNQYFGYKRRGYSEEKKEARRAKRRNRIWEYREFAEAVDRNLQIIAGEITDVILPEFVELTEKAGIEDNRLFIQIHSYSDIRPVEKGASLGEKQVNYISATFDNAANEVETEKVSIMPGASLVGEENETLSNLRAYYGYREVLRELKQDSLFMDFLQRGEALLPDEVSSESEFKSQFAEKKIIFLIKGMKIDPKKKYKYAGYIGKEEDFSALDPVRRINVIVNRKEFVDGRIMSTPCCSETPERP